LAATKKEDKYSGLAAGHLPGAGYQPIAVETLGPIIESASDFFSLLTKKNSIIPATSERQFFLFLFQRVSVLVQRFNGVLLQDSFV